MFVVIVGDLSRTGKDDQEEVLELIEELKEYFSDLVIVSAACEDGIGKFVKDRCIQDKTNPDVGFIEYSVKPWTRLDRARLAQMYMARNPSLQEIGEVFHIFTSGREKGHIHNLVERIKEAKLPLMLHNLDGTKDKFNYPGFRKKINRGKPLQSLDLKSQLE